MADGNVHRTAGMLGMFSAFMMVEGITRTTQVLARNHDEDDDLNADWDGIDGRTFPEWVLFIGGIVEIVAAGAGLALALGVQIFESHSPAVSKIGLVVMLSAWFTFIVFTFAKPAFDSDKLDFSPHPSLTLDQWRGAVTLGIFGSAGYSAAMLGGQVFFGWQLWRIGLGEGATYNKQYHASRLIYYSALAGVAGLAQMAIGILVRDKVGDGRLGALMRVAAPPFFIIYPGLNVTGGLLVIAAAVAGFVRALIRHAGGRVTFGLLWAAVWVVQILFMGVTQLGLWSKGGPLARQEVVAEAGGLVGLTLSLSVMPTYMDAMT
ncbi:unnamed protein product [Ostreobium quekettii]|uniref:Uncharacterized protein n=1 Tax=Ostreobium quekettii TaxID=121088 RepID=A0A8S1IL00_9CHLO|nr:unnamed protein product [Ostreobium quekettii]|eukprot:evm.model.scf_1.9 EVM.evm.TU.scf_1.9   scf_1:220879-221838(-)